MSRERESREREGEGNGETEGKEEESKGERRGASSPFYTESGVCRAEPRLNASRLV